MVRRWPDAPGYQARIRRLPKGAPSGAGLLCTDARVITCAHVVSPDQCPRPVFVDFPFAENHEPIGAAVVDGCWRPSGQDGTSEDLAMLLLDSPLPEGAWPAPLFDAVAGEAAHGHRFHVCGYPVGHDDGVLAHGSIAGLTGSSRLQLQTDTQTGHSIRKGFSGAPIWDEQLGAVVGIVDARDQMEEVRIGYGPSVQLLRRIFPDILVPPTPLLHVRGPGDSESTFLLPRGRDAEYVTLGRGGDLPESDIVLGRDAIVGRQHCRLVPKGSRWELHDNESKNGTFLRHRGSAKYLRVTDPVLLRHGDVIYIRASPVPGHDTSDQLPYWELEFKDPGVTFSV